MNNFLKLWIACLLCSTSFGADVVVPTLKDFCSGDKNCERRADDSLKLYQDQQQKIIDLSQPPAKPDSSANQPESTANQKETEPTFLPKEQTSYQDLQKSFPTGDENFQNLGTTPEGKGIGSLIEKQREFLKDNPEEMGLDYKMREFKAGSNESTSFFEAQKAEVRQKQELEAARKKEALQAEKIANEKRVQQKLEEEKQAQEKQAQEKLEQEKQAQEKLEEEKQEQEKQAQEKQELEKLEQEKLEQEKAAEALSEQSENVSAQ